jgi:hypothetical protein
MDLNTNILESMSPLPPSADFGESAPSITFSSKMNLDDDDESAPF